MEVGYSDHSLGFEASIMSITLGAKIFEKHFTLNKNFKGQITKQVFHLKS